MNKIWISLTAASALGAVTAANLRRALPKPTALGTQKYAVKKQVLTVPAKGHTLFGELLLPEGVPGKLPTVICCHGFGSSYRSCEISAGTSLAMSGYAVYCFDFYGGSTHSKSGGSMTEMSVFTERDDLLAVLDVIKRLPTTDENRLFLLGESQGGFVSAITAAQRTREIRALILWYPAFCIPEDARKRHPDQESIPDTYRIMGRKVGRVYSEGLYDYDVFSEIQDYGGPVLILHGDWDRIVQVSYAERAEKGYRDAKLIVLPGEDHGFSAEGKQQASKLSYDFLESKRKD